MGDVCATYELQSSGQTQTGEIRVGELQLSPFADGAEGELAITPGRGWDVGAGPGQPHSTAVRGGVVGLILDGRGRPLALPEDDDERRTCVRTWNQALQLYGEAD
jgi:hypothetical protein